MNPKGLVGGKSALPNLGQQPALPNNTAVRIVQPEEEVSEQALVPTYPYFEEDPTLAMVENSHFVSSSTPAMPEIGASYQMDHQTHMFVLIEA